VKLKSSNLSFIITYRLVSQMVSHKHDLYNQYT